VAGRWFARLNSSASMPAMDWANLPSAKPGMISLHKAPANKRDSVKISAKRGEFIPCVDPISQKPYNDIYWYSGHESAGIQKGVPNMASTASMHSNPRNSPFFTTKFLSMLLDPSP
jgi:hypothetical protein